MNKFILKRQRDFKLLQLNHFDSIKQVEPSYLVQNQSYQKLLKNKALVKKEYIHLRNNRFIFCAVKHILEKT